MNKHLSKHTKTSACIFGTFVFSMLLGNMGCHQLTPYRSLVSKMDGKQKITRKTVVNKPSTTIPFKIIRTIGTCYICNSPITNLNNKKEYAIHEGMLCSENCYKTYQLQPLNNKAKFTHKTGDQCILKVKLVEQLIKKFHKALKLYERGKKSHKKRKKSPEQLLKKSARKFKSEIYSRFKKKNRKECSALYVLTTNVISNKLDIPWDKLKRMMELLLKVEDVNAGNRMGTNLFNVLLFLKDSMEKKNNFYSSGDALCTVRIVNFLINNGADVSPENQCLGLLKDIMNLDETLTKILAKSSSN